MPDPEQAMSDSPIPLPPDFTEIREAGARLIVRKDLAKPVTRALGPLYQAWSRIAQRRFTARGRAGVVSMPLGEGLPAMVVRRYMRGGLMARFNRNLYLGPERAITELIVAEAARSGGLRTPRAIGVLLTRARGPFWRLAFMTEEVADSEDMIHYCCRLKDYPPETAAAEKRAVLREAARQVRLMHDLGIYHADLHLKNLLLRRRPSGAPEVFIMDFDRAAVAGPLTPEQRLRNLRRMAESVRKVRVAAAAITDWDKVRFLRAYLAGTPREREFLRRWARKLARAGRAREVWWTVSKARRDLRGDRIGPLASSGRQQRGTSL